MRSRVAPRRRSGAAALLLGFGAVAFALLLAAAARHRPALIDALHGVVDPVAHYAPLLEPDGNFASCQRHCLARNHRRAAARIDDEACSGAAAGAWCAGWYDAATVHEFCEALCRTQFPADCAGARFLVLMNEYHTGIGSDMHMRTVALTMALSEGRTLAYSPFVVSHWTHAHDEHPPCARGSLDCYYHPITSCSLPPNWNASAVAAVGRAGAEPDSQFLTVFLSWTQYGQYNETTRPRLGSARLDAMPQPWFMAQYVAFLYRPNAHMLASVVLPRAAETFAKHPRAASRLLPERFLSVFIRRGDKYKEAKLRDPDEYWRRVAELCATLDIGDVYVASDSYGALDDALALAASTTPQLRVYFMNATRDAKMKLGMGRVNMMSRFWRQPRVRELMNSALTDFFIARHATAWIGTLSSNVCRAQNEMRMANGRFGSTYASLD